MSTLSRVAIAVCVLLAASGSVWAQQKPMPKESGFSGFVNLGAMYLDMESNMVAGNEIYDVGDSVITSLTESPKSTDSVAPIINFDVRYTFASTRTQLFLGNSLEDFLRLDLTALAGVRQGVSDKSSVSASLAVSSFPAEVWADPKWSMLPGSLRIGRTPARASTGISYSTAIFPPNTRTERSSSTTSSAA